LASLLPPKKSDPSKDFASADGKVGEPVDEKKGEAGDYGSTRGMGRVQEVTLVKGRNEEVSRM